MEERENEESLLRSVALQNAQSILLARQRAEEELLRAKEALELKTQELAHSLAAMRATLESTTDGILVTDGAGKVTGFNERFVTIWRMPREVMETRQHRRLLENTSQYFPDSRQFLARVDDIYATSPPESYDLLELADGRVFERFSRIQFVDNRNVGRVWSFRDITERRRAEEALQKQSEWLRVTLSSIGDAVLTTDTEGRVLSLNGIAETLTGWKTLDAKGHLLAEVFRIINEESRQPAENPAERALREGCVVGLANHTILIARDGTETPIDDSAAPIRDDQGRVHGVVLVFRDIRERKRSEDALRRSERELAEFFENATVGLHWVGADGITLRVNRAELELLGYTRDEYLGRHIAEFHADQHAIDDMLQRLQAGEELRDYQARLRCKDGSIKHVLINSNVLWEDGNFIHSRCFTRDVTDRKRVEETQARLAAIVESSDDAIVGKTLDGRIHSWNTGAERLFGYTAQEAIGELISLLIPPDRQDEEGLIMERLRRGERLEHFETVRLSKQGRRIDISLTISPIRDSTGRVIGASKIARDITARRQVEQALRESEAQFRQLANALPQIVWTARPDGFIDYYNDRWYEFTGFGRDEFGDSSWQAILHPDDVKRSADTYDGCIRSGNLYQIEYRFKDRRTGGFRWFLGRAYPVRDDQSQIVRWFGTCTDIDDTKQAEQTTRFLAAASATLAELTDYESTLQKVASLAVPFFADWCSVDMVESDGSVSRLAVTHADPDKVRFVRELDRRYPTHPSDPGGVGKVVRTGEPEWAAAIPDKLLEGLAKNDEHLGIIRELGFKSFVCVPLKSRGKVLGVLTFVTAESGRNYDIDDLRAAEDLAHRAVIAIENASLLAALRDTDRRKDEFLAMLAHELRNPLSPIRNAVEIFRAKGPPIPELEWARDVIDRQTEQMTRLIDDLLDVSRITTGKIELRKQRVELASVVDNAVESSRPLIDSRGHKLIVVLPPEPIQLDVDPTRLSQVLLNLLNNAAKYMDQGGRIWLTARRDGDMVVIQVKDTGIGIPTEMLPRIFEMFTQVDRSLDRAQGGLGIGLTLVRRLVELHGGTVEARSDGSGNGSEFDVRLPIARAEDAKPPQATHIAENVAAPAKRRLLIVDDNQDSANSLAMLLRLMGNEVHTAYDGLEAVAVATTFRPDVMLLDLGLPKLNGYDVARRIRVEHEGRVVLIALTGWGQEDDRRRSKEAGFNHHLTKPVDISALRALLADPQF